jgi:hypothetical protein
LQKTASKAASLPAQADPDSILCSNYSIFVTKFHIKLHLQWSATARRQLARRIKMRSGAALGELSNRVVEACSDFPKPSPPAKTIVVGSDV